MPSREECLSDLVKFMLDKNEEKLLADGMDEFGQPHCPDCDVVMRTEPHAFACPHCGHLQLLDEVQMPPEFDGPTVGGG